MKPLSRLLIFTFLISSAASETCKPSGIQCIDSHHYQLCVTVNGNGIIGDQTYTCLENQICDDSDSENCPCIDGTLTTTTVSVTAPTCSEAGKYPAPEPNQYYECKYAWLAWRLYTVTCPDGQVFNQDLQGCAVSTTITSTTLVATTISTTAAPVTSPFCTEAGKYPAPAENQYYECKYAWFAWRLYTVSCPDGQVFYQDLQGCAVSTTTTSTTTVATTITTTAAPVTPPTCTEAGKYPAPEENQYYECKYAWFAWNYYLTTCPDGLVYSQDLQNCTVRTTTTSTTTTTTTTTTTAPAPVTPPTCTKAGNYPAAETNQYYECKYAWFAWRLYTVTCPSGQIYSEELQQCAPDL